jgi:hypothetical protein
MACAPADCERELAALRPTSCGLRGDELAARAATASASARISISIRRASAERQSFVALE